MSVVDKIKELTKEMNESLVESGAKEKAKAIGMTFADVVEEGLRDIETAVEEGVRSLELKYNENMTKIQAEKRNSEMGSSDVTASLKTLADLHKSGVLTDDEFSSAKTKLLDRL